MQSLQSMGKVMSADEKVIDAESKKVAESVSEQTTENAVEEVVKEPAANSAAEENIKKENKKSDKKQFFLILLCWVSYLFAYLGRYGFSANINLIISDYGVTKSDVGLVVSLFFFAYGAGQIVNGILSKKYNKRVIVPISLVASALLNLSIFLGIPFVYIKYLWLLNGFVQSILWPTLIESLSKHLGEKKLKVAIIFMSTSTPLGTFIVYGLSAILVSFNVYKFIFLVATISMSVAGILWFFLYNKCKNKKMFKQNIDVLAENSTFTKTKNPKKKLASALVVFIVIMAVFAVCDNLIKDGLTTWVPTIFKDLYGLPDNMSILLTLLLPLLGTFGSLFAIVVNKKIKDYTMLTSLFYAICAVLLVLSLVVVKTHSSWIILIVLFGLAVLTMHAVNNILTSMVPLFMRDKINSGLLAGLLNGFCYLGSTISSYGLAKIVEASNSWSTVFVLLSIGAAVCIAIGIVQYFVSKKENKNKLDN